MPPKKPTEFSLPKRLEREYAAKISKIVGRVLPPKKPEQTFQQWLDEIARRSQEHDILEASNWLAGKMVFAVNTANAQAAKDLVTDLKAVRGRLEIDKLAFVRDRGAEIVGGLNSFV